MSNENEQAAPTESQDEKTFVEYPKKTFVEKVVEAYDEVTQRLNREIPEFAGAGIAFVWNLPAHDLDFGLIATNTGSEPLFSIKLSENIARVQHAVTDRISRNLQVAAEILESANKELEELQRQRGALENSSEESPTE